ncbi:salivary c-type lectin [Plakobranchus ocellatus]|uniref:Salivary c-type lectin n=1 Tax=Plakobranchus ocellatus TaxID=259542 RepID=A0AAV4A9N2_9GAST|nr:salivary c-type lectin [Plakobranchus ocellatus]
MSNITGVHIGATDLVTEGIFLWDHSGEPLSETKAFWFNGQPDNKGEEDYVILMINNFGLWNDIKLSHTGSYVCERVHPEYFHSSVVVPPSEDWSDDIHSMSALLTASSKDYHLGHNYVEITSFPDGLLKELSVTDKETAQHWVNVVHPATGPLLRVYPHSHSSGCLREQESRQKRCEHRVGIFGLNCTGA